MLTTLLLFPTPQQSPLEVAECALSALQRGDGRVFWRFASPELKRPYQGRWPDTRAIPTYMPLFRAQRIEPVGGLRLCDARYACRVHVRTACGTPLVYSLRVARQPLHRPACQDDGTVDPRAGCWIVDAISAEW